MKLIFTFTDEPDIAALPASRRYNSPFELPDTALQLPDCKQRVLIIAESVGKLTQAALHITCKELDLKDYPIKVDIPEEVKYKLNHSINVAVISFERLFHRLQHRELDVHLPVLSPPPQHFFGRRGRNRREKKSLARNLTQIGDWWCKTDEERQYANTISTIAEQTLILLNTEPNPFTSQGWRCRGFHPRWIDNSLITRHNKRGTKQGAEERQRQRQEERLKVSQAKMEAAGVPRSTTSPKTGAGRLVGAVPGVFKGVQFRSQLEIRLATELEERGVHWVYESERIGDGNYLVDFYLLDYRSWVEVKGTFEPRDNFLLKEVAKILKDERGEKLYVFSQRKCYLVNPSGFKELSRAEFWKHLLTPPKSK